MGAHPLRHRPRRAGRGGAGDRGGDRGPGGQAATCSAACPRIVRRDCVLASNTSYLDIDLMADVVDAPERVLGLHFFSPAHVMKLLEIVRGGRTAPEALATALALARRIGKVPVIAGVCEGFIGNRIFSRWRQQCDFLLEDGALPAGGGRGAGGVRLRHGAVCGGRPGRARHRLGDPQAAGADARPARALRADRRLDLRAGPVRPEDRRRLLPAHATAGGRSTRW